MLILVVTYIVDWNSFIQLGLSVLCALCICCVLGQLFVPLVEPCCPAQSVCHITVSRLMSERILNIYNAMGQNATGHCTFASLC